MLKLYWYTNNSIWANPFVWCVQVNFATWALGVLWACSASRVTAQWAAALTWPYALESTPPSIKDLFSWASSKTFISKTHLIILVRNGHFNKREHQNKNSWVFCICIKHHFNTRSLSLKSTNLYITSQKLVFEHFWVIFLLLCALSKKYVFGDSHSTSSLYNKKMRAWP